MAKVKAYKPYESGGGLVAGKRYYFPINNYLGSVWKSGLFTGEFDKNASAILMTKAGETWSIPVKDLYVRR